MFFELFETTSSVLAAPGGEITGAEAEMTWLATDSLTIGGNLSYTPSPYEESLLDIDLAPADRTHLTVSGHERPAAGRQGQPADPGAGVESDLLGQLPIPDPRQLESRVPGQLRLHTDEVFYSPFETETQRADSFERMDLRATWASADSSIEVSAIAKNLFDEIGQLQVLREGEAAFFRRTAGVTAPRQYGMEFSYKMGNY